MGDQRINRSEFRARCPAAEVAFWVMGLLIATCAGMASASEATIESAASSQHPMDEVIVIGKLDKHTLKHEISQFVESHAKPSAAISQLSRWQDAVCPVVTGLRAPYGEFVAKQITNLARTVGAPAPAPRRKCRPNVEVVFTAEPQALVDVVARKYRPLLGYYVRTEARKALTFNHPVQSWYVTGTRSLNGWQPPAPDPTTNGTPPSQLGLPSTPGGLSPFNTEAQIDSDDSSGTGETGLAGSHLNHGMRSDLVHALIVVDSMKAKKFTLATVSDYVAMLALTRIASLDACSALPSILDLFSSACTTMPLKMTQSDIAYLKGLYGADLERNLNIEQGEIRDQMMQSISAR
jgi:hypothetical protein